MKFNTPDLCDQFHESRHIQIAEPLFKSFGGVRAFCGAVTTLKVFEDNVLIRATLEEKVQDRVLVVDGGGSHRCALMGGNLARLACGNGWRGVVIYGCVRDSLELSQLPIGILALHAHPLTTHKRGGGDKDCLITVAGVNFKVGHYLYADEDGIVVADEALI